MKRQNISKRLILITTPLLAIACMSQSVRADSNFTDMVTQEGEVTLIGWMQLKGEVMLYADQKSMKNEVKYPNCISGVSENHDPDTFTRFDSKKVKINGIIFSYAELQDEGTPILARKVLANSVIPNFCFGETVLLIKDISDY